MAQGRQSPAELWEQFLALAPEDMGGRTFRPYESFVTDRRLATLSLAGEELDAQIALLRRCAQQVDAALVKLAADHAVELERPEGERDAEALRIRPLQVYTWRQIGVRAHLAVGQNARNTGIVERRQHLQRAHDLSVSLFEGGKNDEEGNFLWARHVEAELLLEHQRSEEALALAETALRDDHVLRQYRMPLEGVAAAAERTLGRTTSALRRLTRALAELEGIEVVSPTLGQPVVERAMYMAMLLGHRAHVYMDLGVLDQALDANDAVERHIEIMRWEVEPPHPTVIRDIHAALWRSANLLHVFQRHDKLLELTALYLEDEDVYGDFPEQRAGLELFQGLTLAALEGRDPERPRQARALLERIRADVPGELNQLLIDHALADIALAEDDFDAAGAFLDAARTRIESWDAAGEERDALRAEVSQAALEGGLARRRGLAGDELLPYLDALREQYHAGLASWARSPLRPGGLGFLYHGSRRGWIGELIRLELAVHGEAGAQPALEELMRAQAQGTLVRSMGGGPGTLAQVRAELCPADGGLLVFLPTPAATHVFAVDREDVVHVELAGDHELLGRIRSYAALVDRILRADDPTSLLEEERRVARELAAEVYPAEIDAALARWSQVTLVGAGLLGRAPIEFLPFSGGEHLATARAVSFLPSLPLGLALARRGWAQAAEPLDYVLVADPELPAEVLGRDDWRVAPLAIEESQLVDLAAPFDPQRTELLLRADATRERVLGTDLGRARVAQFLVHAVQDQDRERPAVLVLGARGDADWRLGCSDIDGLGELDGGAREGGIPSSELVVLTACRTASGPTRLGDDGAAHMGGAWLRAGAQVVWQSPTDLEVQGTLALSRRALAALARGATSAEALRRARAELVASGELATPVHAGMLRVFGLGHRALFEGELSGVFGEDGGPASLVPTWLLALLAVVVLGAWSLARRKA